MTGQLRLHLGAQAVALPRPAGLHVLDVAGVPYLVDCGDEDGWRVLGWYYGYPACCIEAFVARRSTRKVHPVSGHRLCLACAAGRLAPLPRRPAERFGFLHVYDLGDVGFEPPSSYDPPGACM